MKDYELSFRRAGRALIVLFGLTALLGFLVAAHAMADIEGDIKDLKHAMEIMSASWWRELAPGGAVVVGAVAVIRILWKTLQHDRRLLLEHVEKGAKERADFIDRLNAVIKTGEMSANERRDAVETLLKAMTDNTRSIQDYIDEKKKSPSQDETPDQTTIRTGMRRK